jgi:hypothetical protein
MPRDHFSKVFSSPYFQTDFYKNETPGGKMEKKIELFFIKIKKIFKKNGNR